MTTSSAGRVLLACLALAGCAGGRAAQRGGSTPEERIVFVDGPAGRLRVSDGGAGGTPVVLVHGLGGNIDLWRAQLDHLRRSRRAVAIELRGHGRSAPPASGDWSMEALADDVEAAAQALGLDRFVLVGHSMGGCVIEAYAARHRDRLAGLVFADGVASFAALEPKVIAAAIAEDASSIGDDPKRQRAAFEEMLGPNATRATRARVLEGLSRLPPEAFVALRRAMFHFRPSADLAAGSLPIATIEGEGNQFPVVASRIYPSAAHRTIAGASHWLMLDAPEAFDRALDELLPP